MRLVLLGSGSYKSSLTYYRLGAIGQFLSRLGHHVSMVVPSADKYNNFTPDTHPHIDGVSVVQPWQPATRKQIVNLLPYLVTSTWEVLRLRPQLVYMYKPTPITIIGLIPKLLFGTPVVLDLDDLGSEVMRLEGQSSFMVKLVAWCERTALHHANAVVVASTYLERLVREQYPEKSLLVLSNGVDPEDYQALPESAPRHAMYYFGALNRLSLIEPLLRALPLTLKAVPDVRITILGEGSARQDAEALTRELGISDRVFFNGYTEKKDIGKFVQFADLALCTQPDIPTVRAASNLKIFHYMAFATVLVASDVGDYSNYVNVGGKSGLVVPAGNDKKLSEALIYLLTHDDERTEMALVARHKAETIYSWPTLVERLQAFIDERVFDRSPQQADKEVHP